MGGQCAPEDIEKATDIAIVGLGVRGLGVLERLVSHAAATGPAVQLRLHLIDSSPAQPRQYEIHQPDYLLLNHACVQASMFPAPESVAHAPATTGPSLFEWALERELRVAGDGFTVGAEGRLVEPTDNLPRRIFGEYLLWFLQQLRENAPDNVRLVDHLSDAVDVQQRGDGAILTLADGGRVEADFVFVTVGQRPQPIPPSPDGSSSRLIATAYPLPGQLVLVEPTDTVAIAGLGLTSADAIFALTVGRGGRFDHTVSPQRYVPSGREPRIVVFSRSGLPYRARPTPSPYVTYDPVVFTRPAIDELRFRTPLLDFDRDVLPLLLLELRVAYRRAKLLQESGREDAEAFLLSARAAAAEGRLETFAELPQPAEFDAEAVYRGTVSTAAGDGAAYQRSVESWLAADLAQAMRGFEGSPYKAATEICREFRDTIRYAMDFGGLTDDSLDRFYGYHLEAINRLVIGPEKDRAANLLALLRSGVVSMSLGPDPLVSWDEDSHSWMLTSTAFPVPETVRAQWLYRGYTDRLKSLESDETIIGAMARRGLVRRFKPDSALVSALEVDSHGHPVAAGGEEVATRIWISGLLCEGVTFYNGYLTSPGHFERSQSDADRAVNELIDTVREDRQIMTAVDGGARR